MELTFEGRHIFFTGRGRRNLHVWGSRGRGQYAPTTRRRFGCLNFQFAGILTQQFLWGLKLGEVQSSCELKSPPPLPEASAREASAHQLRSFENLGPYRRAFTLYTMAHKCTHLYLPVQFQHGRRAVCTNRFHLRERAEEVGKATNKQHKHIKHNKQ